VTSRTLAGLKAGLKTRPAYFLALLAAGCAALVLQAQELPKKTATAPYTTWSDYGGSADSAQYSALTQINRSNVAGLQVAWTYSTGDPGNYLFNPIVVDNIMYVLAKNDSIVALDAETGKEIWVHPNGRGKITTRGVNYWQSKDRRERRLLYSYNNLLHAIDARTGEAIPSFGVNGVVDLREGLGRDPERISVQSSTPGRVFEDLIILGSATNQEYASAPGDIRAFDVRTGKLAWTFHTIPHAGEFGYDTWPPDAWKTVGGANNWAEMSVDQKRGIVYIPTGSPKYNFYGANRIGANLFGDCLLALDARTGKRLWHFQMVHHDIWDYDNATAPKLLTVRHDGKLVDAVAQAGKTGFLYVFDRVTGKPLWPIEERKVPATDMPGEKTWPTQPFPTAPPPFARQSFTEKDLSPYIDDPAERARLLDDIRNARNEGLFTPPGLRQTIEMPGNNGGSNFGGAAVDPEHGTLIVVSKDYPSMLKLELGGTNASAWRGSPGRGGDPETTPSSAPPAVGSNTGDPSKLQYKSGFGFIVTSSGLSAIAPPWTTMTAYDLNKGTIKWQIPLGEVPELAAKGVTDTGAHFPKVGPVLTAGGLIFTGTRDRKIRALDAETGKVVWQTEVPAGVEGTPAVYEINGRQFVVYCVAARATTHVHGIAGHPPSNAPIEGSYVAFALPANSTK
jgi:quinoprotein glucose dehydrogenase